jgi:hypothetical protein
VVSTARQDDLSAHSRRPMGHDVAAAPDELEELEGELDGTIDEDLEDLEDDELDEDRMPDGFVVEGET